MIFELRKLWFSLLVLIWLLDQLWSIFDPPSIPCPPHGVASGCGLGCYLWFLNLGNSGLLCGLFMTYYFNFLMPTFLLKNRVVWTKSYIVVQDWPILDCVWSYEMSKIIFCQPFLVSWWAEELIDTQYAIFFFSYLLGPLGPLGGVGWGGPSQVELIGHVIHNILFCYPFLDSWRAEELIDTHHAMVFMKSQNRPIWGGLGRLCKA